MPYLPEYAAGHSWQITAVKNVQISSRKPLPFFWRKVHTEAHSRSGKVASLYLVQKSCKLIPAGPNTVPTGGAGVAFPAGICNLILNVFVMLMAVTDLSPSLIYPVIGVGGLAVITVFSLLVFKEKMRWWQWLGVAVGAIAVLLLSI